MTDLNIIGVIEDFNQAVLDNEQKIIFNLNSVDPNIKQYKTLFKSREELIDSIKILYKKCESDNPLYEKRIEQNIKFIKFVNSSNSIYCKTIHFNNGRQKNISNNIITSASEQISNNLNDNPLPYDVNLLEIHPCENASVNDCISAIIELKLNIIMKGWTLSIILAKYWCASIEYSKILNIPEKYVSKKLNIHSLNKIKSKLLNSEFTVDNFINNVPYDYADQIKIVLEFNSTNFNILHIKKAVSFLENSLIDTCRTCPQDIYIKTAGILKLSLLHKFQSGEFGIKQLTSRVVTLDHDILHKELIPHLKDYAVSEKSDGITSIVLIFGKDIFITCGAIVYKFDVLNFPELPSTKNIDALGLNKMDFNNIWIFDAEVIIGHENHITIIPFDIRMASSINLDNINFKYRLMFMKGLQTIKTVKTSMQIKRWYCGSDIKTLYNNSINSDKKIDGFIFAYLENLPFTTSMYYSSKVWKWKPSLGIDHNIVDQKPSLGVDHNIVDQKPSLGVFDNNTVDFLIQKCPDIFKGKSPYIAGGKSLYVLCCGLSKAVHQTLPNIIIVQSLIPNNANEYIPALFTPSDRPFSHLFWSDNTTLHGEIGEFLYNKNTKEWSLIKIRTDRKIEVERGNYYGNDHATAEKNWFMMNYPLLVDDIKSANHYVNNWHSKSKFITSIYENLIKHVLINTETILNICPYAVMDVFNKFISVIYAIKNTIEANRYIKDKYELTKKKIRFNSYYVNYDNVKNIKNTLVNSTIPISNNGVDNLLLIYSINKNDGTPGFGSLMEGMYTVKLYENLITHNGKIIIVVAEANDEKNYKISAIDEAFTASRYTKTLDIFVNKWVYISDNDLYETSRVLIFTRV